MKRIINLSNIIDIIVIFSCCEVAYFNYINQSYTKILMISRLVLIAFLLLKLFSKRNKNIKSKTFLIISTIMVMFTLISIFRKIDIIYYIVKLFSKPYLIVLYIQLYFDKNDRIKKLLQNWRIFLFILCMVDFATVLYYPKGMFMENNYNLNWFLGYKTARMVYSWPLMFISSYLDFYDNDRKKISKTTILCLAMCVYTTFKTQATGASTALLLYAALVYFLKLERASSKKLYFIFNPKRILLYSAIIYFLVMSIESNTYIQNIVITIFKKSTTLSNRTGIWKNCFEFFLKSPIFGKGIFTPLEYISISKYYLGTNAHNFLLTLLVSGGIVCVVLYILMFNASMHRENQRYSKREMTLIYSIITFVFVGLTSSTMVFSMGAYLPFMLLEYEKIKNKEEN